MMRFSTKILVLCAIVSAPAAFAKLTVDDQSAEAFVPAAPARAAAPVAKLKAEATAVTPDESPDEVSEAGFCTDCKVKPSPLHTASLTKIPLNKIAP